MKYHSVNFTTLVFLYNVRFRESIWDFPLPRWPFRVSSDSNFRRPRRLFVDHARLLQLQLAIETWVSGGRCVALSPQKMMGWSGKHWGETNQNELEDEKRETSWMEKETHCQMEDRILLMISILQDLQAAPTQEDFTRILLRLPPAKTFWLLTSHFPRKSSFLPMSLRKSVEREPI